MWGVHVSVCVYEGSHKIVRGMRPLWFYQKNRNKNKHNPKTK